MNCQMMMSLGVYVLGAAEPAERRSVEAHLPGCPSCRAELIRLAPIPGLLASVPPGAVQQRTAQPGLLANVPPSAVKQRTLPPVTMATDGSALIGRLRSAEGSRRVRIGAIATALAASAAVAVGVVLGASSGPLPGGHSAVLLSGMNPATHVGVTAALTPSSWGTSIRLTIRGAPLNVRCWLVVRSRAGGTETAGVWDAWREGPITVPASSGWRASDIASLQVVARGRTLVTIKAARHAPAREPAARRL
jgi:hypothetical protein